MLFALMMALLFVAPLCGYYWLWQKYRNLSEIAANIKWAFFTLVFSFIIYYVIIIHLGLIYYLFVPFSIIFWLLILLWGFVGPFALAIYFYFAKRETKQKVGSPSKQGNILLILLIVLFNLGPVAGYTMSTTDCYYFSLSQAEKLAVSLDSYHKDFNRYPTNLYQLEDNGYISPFPMPDCPNRDYSWYCGFSWDGEFWLKMLDGRGNIEIYSIIWFFGFTIGGCGS